MAIDNDFIVSPISTTSMHPWKRLPWLRCCQETTIQSAIREAVLLKEHRATKVDG